MADLLYLRAIFFKITMNRNTISLLCLFILLPLGLSAQTNVKNYFNMRLDSIVAQLNASSPTDETVEENTSPAFYRMFAPIVLYKETVNNAVAGKPADNNCTEGSGMDLHDKRNGVIDNLLLELYRSHPLMVQLTEDDLRSVVSASDFRPIQNVPEIVIDDNTLQKPIAVEATLETKVVKPNYWRTSGNFSFNFTQNYFSGNWAQGGDNNRTLIANLVLRLNYNDKKKISFENTFEAKLGFVNVSGDTLHNYRTNNDMLRLQSRIGYKIMDHVDVTGNMTLQTQSMPNYPTNNRDFVSNFMAPFDAVFSLGVNYKRSGKKWNLSVFFAPLSSYNYKFVRYGSLASRYGIRAGRHHKEDFGTQIQPTFNIELFKNVNYTGRADFYTNYSRTSFNWENTFTMSINKYLKTTLFVHARFDDSSSGLYSDSYGYWQLKEYLSLALTYSW